MKNERVISLCSISLDLQHCNTYLAVAFSPEGKLPDGKLTLLVKLTGELKVAVAPTLRESVDAEPRMAAPVTLRTAVGAMLRLLCSCSGASNVAFAWKVEGPWKLEAA